MAQKLKVIPLGGMNEIGKNMYIYEYGTNIMIVDTGVMFPDEDMFGVDLVIPDISYLIQHKNKIKGIVLTHGHEDHIGALPYVLREIDCPIYCTRLTAGIIELRLAEHKLLAKAKINRINPGQSCTVGCFNVEFIPVNHSVADSVALAISTPVGMVFHTGDFKIDTTPVQGEMIDLARIGELGKKGILLLLSDSTNVERPGYTMSERSVGEAFAREFKNCDKRIIVATFSSNVHRIQQIIDAALAAGRKVAISGRSMENILSVATELGYITIPPDALVDIGKINKYPRGKTCIITTGSQGEPMSALYRMAFATHKQIEISKDDKIIISATPIPGNEKTVYRLVNELFKKGAEVVYERMADVHVSGHACQQELKMLLALCRPQYFMPMHGEFRHLKAHAALARSVGITDDRIFVSDIGRILEINKECIAKLGGTVQSGKVLVDGYGVGDVGSVVLRDRKHLSTDGLLVIVITLDGHGNVISGPDVISRGFMYSRESESIIESVKVAAVTVLGHCQRRGISDWSSVKGEIRDAVNTLLVKGTNRSPMILPVLNEV